MIALEKKKTLDDSTPGSKMSLQYTKIVRFHSDTVLAMMRFLFLCCCFFSSDVCLDVLIVFQKLYLHIVS